MFFLSAKRCEVERGLHLLRRFLLFVVYLFRSLVNFLIAGILKNSANRDQFH